MDVAEPRNPGPSWGYRALVWWDAHLPAHLRDAVVFLGSAVAYAIMPAQRRASREYLRALLGPQAGLMDNLRHFDAITHSLLAKLRAGQRVKPHIDWVDDANREAGQVIYADEPILLGTFHVGASDLLGFHARQTGRRVTMIRQRVANSEDIDRLVAQSGDAVEIIWVNDEAERIFALRDALDAGKTLALQCDRVDHASKCAGFEFLGAVRTFPITIYRLAMLYQRPVLFCLALPGEGRDDFGVHACPPYRPTGDRSADHAAALAHFQGVLRWLEARLRAHPYQWFNFLPLNPPWPESTNTNTCRTTAKKRPSDDT